MAKKQWENFKGKLPEWQGDDVDRIQQIQTIKTKLAEKTNPEIARLMKDLKFQKEELEAELSNIELQYEACQRLLSERLENDGTSSFRLDTGELFYIEDVPYAQIKDKTQSNIWFIENGMDELRSVNWQTLNAIVKERLKNGDSLPEGVDVYMKTTVKMRRN